MAAAATSSAAQDAQAGVASRRRARAGAGRTRRAARARRSRAGAAARRARRAASEAASRYTVSASRAPRSVSRERAPAITGWAARGGERGAGGAGDQPRPGGVAVRVERAREQHGADGDGLGERRRLRRAPWKRSGPSRQLQHVGERQHGGHDEQPPARLQEVEVPAGEVHAEDSAARERAREQRGQERAQAARRRRGRRRGLCRRRCRSRGAASGALPLRGLGQDDRRRLRRARAEGARCAGRDGE